MPTEVMTSRRTMLQALARISCRAGWAWLIASLPLAWVDLQGRWLVPGREWASLIKLWIYWGSWASLPLLLDAAIRLRHRPRPMMRWLWALSLALVAYSGLIEPGLLYVHRHRIALHNTRPDQNVQPLRIALVADIHAGLFVRAWQVGRLVDALNALDVDAIVVAGDWTYDPHTDLHAVLAPMRRLQRPVFGVLGNHDTQAPGPDLEQPLRQALQQLGVQLLEGRSHVFKGWELVGLSDLWGGSPHVEIAQLLQQPGHLPRLVVMHQPDTAALMPPAGGATVMVSGHTHGGQIRLPWITHKLVLPGTSKHGWYAGQYSTPAGELFVTAGTGTIGLPARLGAAPRIDVLELAP